MQEPTIEPVSEEEPEIHVSTRTYGWRWVVFSFAFAFALLGIVEFGYRHFFPFERSQFLSGIQPRETMKSFLECPWRSGYGIGVVGEQEQEVGVLPIAHAWAQHPRDRESGLEPRVNWHAASIQWLDSKAEANSAKLPEISSWIVFRLNYYKTFWETTSLPSWSHVPKKGAVVVVLDSSGRILGHGDVDYAWAIHDNAWPFDG